MVGALRRRGRSQHRDHRRAGPLPDLDAHLRPLEDGLVDLPRVTVTPEGVSRLRNGNPGMVIATDVEYGEECWAASGDRAVAVGRYKAGTLHPSRVFNAGQPMIDAFIDRLAATEAPPGCVNPYSVYLHGVDISPEAPAIRRRQLSAYLHHRQDTARLMLVAEAPGYQGARFSGIAMTCERTLLGQKPGVPPEAVLGDVPGQRTSHPETGRNRPETRTGSANRPPRSSGASSWRSA